jgi:phenylalanine-4-hydroxylase
VSGGGQSQAASRVAELVELDSDHPGFRDPIYRRRRNAIAQLALDYREGQPVPEIPYTEDEHAVWRHVWAHLEPLHARLVCAEVNEAAQLLPLDRRHIPQLAEVNRVLGGSTAFTMTPVAGLVAPRIFLVSLARGVFLSTQYMRHHSRPLYTPEPDVVHELVGHAATLAHPRFAALNRRFGKVAEHVPDHRMERLIRAYWYTLEFGLVREAGELRALGAGLLSSYGELGAFATRAEIRSLDLERVAGTPFDPTDYQRCLYAADSFTALERALFEWLDREGAS